MDRVRACSARHVRAKFLQFDGVTKVQNGREKVEIEGDFFDRPQF